MAQELFLIYARAANGTIGREGALPWHLPADLKHFKALTMGKAMIMGRTTFEGFPKPLPGRRHIVLTRDKNWQADGAEPVQSVDEALRIAGDGEVAIIGGAQIYALFMPLAGRIELTEIHADYDGDTFMPELGGQWHEDARHDFAAAEGKPAYSFVTMVRG